MMLDAWACVYSILPANAWRSALLISISSLLSVASYPSLASECLLFCSHSACSAWQFIKGNTSFFLAPRSLISTAADVTADKRQQGPRITVHMASVFTASFSPPLTREEEEKRRKWRTHCCIHVSLHWQVSSEGEVDGLHGLHWSHQSALFNTPGRHACWAQKNGQKGAFLLLLTYSNKHSFQLDLPDNRMVVVLCWPNMSKKQDNVLYISWLRLYIDIISQNWKEAILKSIIDF